MIPNLDIEETYHSVHEDFIDEEVDENKKVKDENEYATCEIEGEPLHIDLDLETLVRNKRELAPYEGKKDFERLDEKLPLKVG